MPENLYAAVAVEAPVTTVYHYLIPEGLRDAVRPGSRVTAPFGGRKIHGFCVEVSNACPIDPKRCKPLLSAGPEGEIVLPELLALTKWAADYYHAGWGMVLAAAVPAGVRRNAQVRAVTIVCLTAAMADLQAYRDGLKSSAAAQLAVCDFFLKNPGITETPQSDLLEQLQLSGPACLKTLEKKNIVRLELRKVSHDQVLLKPQPKTILLTAEQRDAVSQINAAIDRREFSPFLLHGITGSGKTEVYIQAMNHALEQGLAVLILVPEISLTPQTVGRFKQSAGEVLSLHSYMADSERAEAWRRLRSGEVRVVVGARSAVFSPMPNLGLIIVDEEHEHTFKQESYPRYHGRDLAVMRGASEKAVVVLGSATPSLESWHNAQTGKYKLLSLTERPGGARIPETCVVDMSEEFREQKKVVTFSRELIARTEKCLQAGQQAILFLNRRGFNTEVRCKACGEPLKCESCSVALTYHKLDGLMRCHYCDYAARPPDKCPVCGTRALQFSGTGTERAEKVLNDLFPDARLLRMDSDTMTGRDAHGKALNAFAAGEYDILLGTQMVTKGFDFPNVTLVGVLAADSAINMPDFRAAEKTFQLVTQVIGRAGRAEKSGTAVIQAFQPEHYAVQFALRQDFCGFAEFELRERRPFGYPPFGRLARIIITGGEETAAKDLGAEIAGLLKTAAPEIGRVLGPAPCVLEKLQGLFRFHILVKAPDHRELRRILRTAENYYTLNKQGLQVTVDIDPLSMM